MKVEPLQKILAASGIASRRAAETMIEEGRVRVNGRIVKELGAKADPRSDRIEVDGVKIVAEKHVYVVLHKPRSVVSTMSDPEGRPTVQHYLDKIGARVVPVGRLDFATSGVLLATNDGDFSFTLLHPKQKVPKTYVLKVTGEMKEADLEKWRTGIELDDGMTRPAEVTLIRYENGKTWLELTITEGRNQMIRRMGEKSGFYVMRLARMSFAGISSENLAPGKWRMLTREELLTLKKNYGVPKTVHAQAEDPVAAGRSDRHFSKSTRGAFGGGGAAGSRSHRTAPQPDREMRGRKGRARSEEARERPEAARPRGPNTHARRNQPREPLPKKEEKTTRNSREKAPNFRDRSAAKKSGTDARPTSPAARSAQWKKDEAPREPYGLGRGGRSRTTGTGGGVGGKDDGNYRIERTRRGR
jgi:23S rRNA pseudouridine2605 synthase